MTAASTHIHTLAREAMCGLVANIHTHDNEYASYIDLENKVYILLTMPRAPPKRVPNEPAGALAPLSCAVLATPYAEL